MTLTITSDDFTATFSNADAEMEAGDVRVGARMPRLVRREPALAFYANSGIGTLRITGLPERVVEAMAAAYRDTMAQIEKEEDDELAAD